MNTKNCSGRARDAGRRGVPGNEGVLILTPKDDHRNVFSPNGAICETREEKF